MTDPLAELIVSDEEAEKMRTQARQRARRRRGSTVDRFVPSWENPRNLAGHEIEVHGFGEDTRLLVLPPQGAVLFKITSKTALRELAEAILDRLGGRTVYSDSTGPSQDPTPPG